MTFDDIHALIPVVYEGKQHEFTTPLGEGESWAVDAAYPGKHGPGDFVVRVTDDHDLDRWSQRKFTHASILQDVQMKYRSAPFLMTYDFLPHLLWRVQGAAPHREDTIGYKLPGLHLDALLLAMTAVSVAEHRRLPDGDARGGGRYLPINFALGILTGRWTAYDAVQHITRGFPAFGILDKTFVPFKHDDSVDTYMDGIRAVPDNFKGAHTTWESPWKLTDWDLDPRQRSGWHR